MKKVKYITIQLLLILPLTIYSMNNSIGPYRVKQKELSTAEGTWRYSVSNSGNRAVLFIHGANSSSNIWRNQHEVTFQGYQNIFIDLLGYGESDKPTSGYGLANWIQGINSILEKEQVKQVAIVAHSNGVILAKEYYRAYPNQVSHLVLLDGMLKQMIKAPILDWMKSTLERSDYESFMQANVDRMPVMGLAAEDVEVLKQDALNTPKRVAQAEFELVTDTATWQPLTIQCPVTIVHANSPMWNEEYVSWLSSITPDHRLIQWEDSGHFIPMQYPDRLNELIAEVVLEQ